MDFLKILCICMLFKNKKMFVFLGANPSGYNVVGPCLAIPTARGGGVVLTLLLAAVVRPPAWLVA